MNKVTLNPQTIVDILKGKVRTIGGLARELNLTPEIVALCVLRNLEMFNVSKSLSDEPLIYLKQSID
jgi:hypothetical protein